MKKIALVLIGLSVLASCSVTPSPTPPKWTEDAVVLPVTTYQQDISNTSDKIKNTEEFQGCMKQQSTMCIQTVGMQIAQKTKDPAFCKELSTPEEKWSCEFAIAMVNAQEKNDIKFCDTLTDANYLRQCKIQTYRQIAMVKKDINLCDKIKETDSGSGEIDSVDTETQRDQCVMQFIMSESDSKISDCNKLTSKSSLDMCKMMIKNRVEMNMPVQ